jgi:hypothetical protein
MIYFLKSGNVKTPLMIPVSMPKSVPPKHAYNHKTLSTSPRLVEKRTYSSSKRKSAPIVDFRRIGFDSIVAHDFAH